MTSAESAVSLDEALVRALRDATTPLTVRQLQEHCDDASAADIRAALEELQQEGRVFPAPPRNRPRFWGYDVQQRALEALRAELRDGPRTKTQLLAGLGKRLKGVGVPSRSEWLQAQLFCHAASVPLLAYRLVHLMRPPARVRPGAGIERGIEIVAACLTGGGFGLLIVHLNGYAGITFTVLAVLAVVAVLIAGRS
jgi:hypothetical protein